MSQIWWQIIRLYRDKNFEIYLPSTVSGGKNSNVFSLNWEKISGLNKESQRNPSMTAVTGPEDSSNQSRKSQNQLKNVFKIKSRQLFLPTGPVLMLY